MDKTKYHQDLIIPIRLHSDSIIQILDSENFNIIFIMEGYGHVMINDSPYALNGPGILCLNNNESLRIQNDSSLKIKSLEFSPLFINSNFSLDKIKRKRSLSLVTSDMDMYWLTPFLRREDNYFGFIKSDLNSKKIIDNLFNRIIFEIDEKRDKYWPCRTRSIFMELLFMLDSLRSQSSMDKANRALTEDEFINKVILYINMNYDQPISLTTLCSEFAVNRTTLGERFHKVTGYTIINYINQVRIQMACTLLKETYLNITEIMYKCGFNTTANFNKTFKNIVGKTPKDFRSGFCK